jgi:predicted exporter
MVLLFVGFFARTDWGDRFATDVSTLLPEGETDDRATRFLGQIREREQRLILAALLPPPAGWAENREAAAVAALEALRKTGLFEQVSAGAGPSDPDALARTIYEARLDFLLPLWAEAHGLSVDEPDAEIWAEAIIASLDDFLVQPEAAALGELIPRDPFPLSAFMAEAAPASFAEENADGPFLFWARQTVSPFARAGQQPILQAFAEAEAAATVVVSGATMRHAAVAGIAIESERRIRQEITWLNGAGILLVGLVAFLFLRRRLLLLHLLAVAAVSLAGGLATVLLFFPVVHVLSLVVGGLLVGVAVDYGIHILLHRPSNPEDGFALTLREVRKPLLASALSTAAGFTALTFADLILIQQIGAFVAGGLVMAMLGCFLWFPLWRRPIEISRLTPPPGAPAHRPPFLLPAAFALLLIPLLGWFNLAWRDDLRELQPPLTSLLEQDAQVRHLFAQGEQQAAWLVHGPSPREARGALEAFETAWEGAGGERNELLSLAPWIAPPSKSLATREIFAGMEDFEETLTRHLEEAGYEADGFSPFFSDLRAWLYSPSQYASAIANAAATLDGPSALLLRQTEDGWWFVVSAPAGKVPAGWEAPDGSIATDQLETLNALFSQYRQTAWRLSGVALLVIAAAVLAAYGWANGGLSLLLPAVAWAWGMGLLAGIASPLNLFHLLGGFLGFCVALDYGLFFRHARRSGRGLPVSIRLSAATILSAFGVLALSSIPAVAGLGASVFLVVLGGFFLVELASRLPRKTKAF